MDIEALETNLLNALALPSSDYGWMLTVFTILLATGLISVAMTIIYAALARSLKKTTSNWDDVLLESTRKPLKALVWIMGVSYAIDAVMDETKADILNDLLAQRDVAVVMMVAWALSRFLTRGEKVYIEQRRKNAKSVDLTTINAVTKLLKISLVISAVLVVLQNMGISVSGVLAFGGIGGIAVGFAAKDMLANFFGAMIIYMDKPFKVGDWIRSPDQNIEGTVENIGWRMTTIRTFDKRPLYVPNSIFTTISVENPSRMSHRRIYETVGIRYDDIGVMQAITDEVRQMLIDHPDIDESQTLIVHFDTFNTSSCDFFIYTFTHTKDWVTYHGVKQDVLLKVAAIIDAHNAEIAYPTQVEYTLEKAPKKQAEAA